MRRCVSVLLAAILVLPLATSAAAAPAAVTACTKGDVDSLAHGAIAVAMQSFRGREMGSSGAWSCQFRLYDGNEDPEDNPEIPHVFKASDWFLGGIFYWWTFAELEEFGWTRQEGLAHINAIEDHLFWRPAGGQWTELPLSRTVYRGVPSPSGVAPVMQHRCYIFAAGSLAPGVYEWRWDNFDLAFDPPEFTAYGEVHVVAD